MKIGNNNEYKENKNANNNDKNDDNIRFLMTKTLMIVKMEELVTITVVIIIMGTYR